MAFARSASGPSGLSINTGAANAFSASVSSQPPAAGGLFGSTSATQPSTQSTSLFGNNNTTTTNNTNTSQPSQTSSFFGGQSNQQQQQQQQQQQPAGGGLFGSNMATSKPGGLFGSTTTGTGSTGGLFGNTTTGTGSTGGGLFSNSTAATSQPAQAGGSIFGAPAQQPAASTTTGTGGMFGFGAPTTTTNNQTSGATGTAGGMFGQKPAATTGGSMFGQSAAPAGSFFSSFNQNPQTQQQQTAPPALGSTMGPQVAPGVRIDMSNIRNTTRFNDLHDDLQKQIAEIDTHIQNCIAQKDQVDAFIPAHEAQLESIPDDVRFVSRKHAAVDSALGADLHAIKAMRDQVRADADEAKLSFIAIDNLKLPAQYHQTPSFGSSTRQNGTSSNGDGATAEDLVSYFSRATDEMDEHVKKLQKTVREIDSHLGGVEQNILEQASRLQASTGALGGGSQDDRYMELYHVLRDFEEGIVQVATVVGGAREGVTELQMNDFRGRGVGSY